MYVVYKIPKFDRDDNMGGDDGFLVFCEVLRNKMCTFASINGENHIGYWPRNEPDGLRASEGGGWKGADDHDGRDRPA